MPVRDYSHGGTAWEACPFCKQEIEGSSADFPKHFREECPARDNLVSEPKNYSPIESDNPTVD